MMFASETLWGAWAAYLAAFLANHLRVRRARRGAEGERRVQSAPEAALGGLLQFSAVVVTFAWRRPESTSTTLIAASLLCAAFSVWLTWASLAYLGRQWRLQAVVTDDHELVTTGPYRWVRHPIYMAFFGMLASNVLLFTEGMGGAAALGLFVIGTEIRIRAEERVLQVHFAERFTKYRSRTAAWLPPFR